MNAIKKHSSSILIYMLVAYTFFACVADTNITFQILLYALIIIAPLFLDDSRTICLYVYSACFMACLGKSGFLLSLNISMLILEIKKILKAFIYKENIKEVKQVCIIWLVLLAVLTIYTLIYNNFKTYRMKNFIDFAQCCIVYYLVRKNINLKNILFHLFAGIVLSSSIAIIFEICLTRNDFMQGSISYRFGGFFNNINVLSTYCTLCSAGFISLIITNEIDIKKYWHFPLIITSLGLLTKSKAFIVLNILLYITWLIIAFKKSNNKQVFKKYILISLFIIAIVGIIAKDYVWVIIKRFIDGDYTSFIDNLTTGRTGIWSKYMDKWLTSPLTFLFGNGYAAPKIYTGQYEHSVYVAFLHQFGIIGSVIIISVIIWTICKNATLNKNVVYYIPLIAMLVNGIVENVSGILFSSLPWLLAFLFITHKSTQNNKKSINNH